MAQDVPQRELGEGLVSADPVGVRDPVLDQDEGLLAAAHRPLAEHDPVRELDDEVVPATGVRREAGRAERGEQLLADDASLGDVLGNPLRRRHGRLVDPEL